MLMTEDVCNMCDQVARFGLCYVVVGIGCFDMDVGIFLRFSSGGAYYVRSQLVCRSLIGTREINE